MSWKPYRCGSRLRCRRQASSRRFRPDGCSVIGFLRRRQPRNPVLAILYWIVVILVVVGLLFVIFYFADDLLPGQGMF
jgi:hypothetical protein